MNHASVVAAKTLYLEQVNGVLASHSIAMPGYPFASVVPFCLDSSGAPIILISSIAQHTKNIIANDKVSLLVQQAHEGNVQEVGRLTLVGDAQPVQSDDQENIAQRYYRFFPDAGGYHQTHNFSFYRINIRRLRFIGGFGQIHWFEPSACITQNPFDYRAESSIINHMNDDHADAIEKYLLQLSAKPSNDFAMVGIDQTGMHLRNDRKIYRYTFSRSINDAKQAREILIELARQ